MADDAREKWDARYRDLSHAERTTPPWLREVDDELPREGAALDVAAGSGRIALWLARHGLEVTAVDISPVGLALAREAASDEGVRIRTHVADLERDPLPAGPYVLVACFDYRQPDLWPAVRGVLAPGGIVLVQQPTVRNLERSERPSRRWLTEPNELLAKLSGLEVVYYREGWLGDRHLARMVARRNGS